MKHCFSCRVRDGMRTVMLCVTGAACAMIFVHLYMHGDALVAFLALAIYLLLIRF